MTESGLEAYPILDEIVFDNPERTKATAKVTIADTWATLEMEKEGERWIVRRVAEFWIVGAPVSAR